MLQQKIENLKEIWIELQKKAFNVDKQMKKKSKQLTKKHICEIQKQSIEDQ